MIIIRKGKAIVAYDCKDIYDYVVGGFLRKHDSESAMIECIGENVYLATLSHIPFNNGAKGNNGNLFPNMNVDEILYINKYGRVAFISGMDLNNN